MENSWIGGRFIFDPAKYRQFRRKYGIVIKAVIIAAAIAGLKYYVDLMGLSIIPMNSLITSLVGGIFFIMGILFAGAIADYKESEKVPGELSASIKSMYSDTKVIPMAKKDQKLLAEMRVNIVALLSTINSNFRRNVWKLKEISQAIDMVTDNIRVLAEKGVTPGYLTKFRSELTSIDRICHRVDTITETTFLPAAYTIAQVAIISILSLLLFVDFNITFGAPIILGVAAAILVSLVFLINDVDSPFEVNQNSYADVDLSLLFSLEEYMKSITPGVKALK
ncbi:MAG: hypothetical protein JW727_00455 [Candidatus Aenigmarchaeota archaeon]|nr:hypothetical protein [Candidatus Aenigmarchaeota archaeon]